MSNTYRDTTNFKVPGAKRGEGLEVMLDKLEKAMFDKTSDPRSAKKKKIVSKKSRRTSDAVLKEELVELDR